MKSFALARWKRWATIGVLLLIPTTILFVVLRERASWVPRTLHQGSGVHFIAFSDDGQTVTVVGGNTATLKVWDVPSRTLLKTAPDHPQVQNVGSVQFSPETNMMVGSISGFLAGTGTLLWDANAKDAMHRLNTRGEFVYATAFSPGGRTLLSGGITNARSSAGITPVVKMWNAETGALEKTLHGAKGVPHRVLFSPDGKLAACAAQGIYLWDARTAKLRAAWKTRSVGIASLAFSPDGKFLASSDFLGGAIDLRDVRTGRVNRILNGSWNGASTPTLLVFSPDNTLLAAGYENKKIAIWSVPAGRIVRTLTAHAPHWTRALSFSPDSATLASGSTDGTVKLWRIK